MDKITQNYNLGVACVKERDGEGQGRERGIERERKNEIHNNNKKIIIFSKYGWEDILGIVTYIWHQGILYKSKSKYFERIKLPKKPQA